VLAPPCKLTLFLLFCNSAKKKKRKERKKKLKKENFLFAGGGMKLVILRSFGGSECFVCLTGESF
jgi:hypothetical protein